MTEAAVGDIERRAASLRRHVIRQAAGKGEGYVGQGMQSADIFAALFFNEMNWSGQRLDDPERDRFLLSVGHYAIALYAVLAEAGALSEEQLSTYGADGSHLTLGAEPGDVPGVEFAGGSLGQGLGVGAGLAWGLRSSGSRARVFNYMSDGELQEGAVWEAAMFAAHAGLTNLVNIVDVNRTQADGPLVVEVEPVAEKFRAFGWHAQDVDGHDIPALLSALRAAREQSEQPSCLVVHTTIGQGSETLRSRPRAHFVRIKPDDWAQVMTEVGLSDESVGSSS